MTELVLIFFGYTRFTRKKFDQALQLLFHII